MRRRKLSSSFKRNQTQKRHSPTKKKSRTHRVDPTVPITRFSKRKKTKPSESDMTKNSCWWFG